MLEQLYGWIQNIAVYLIVISAVMHAIPGKDYGKYIRIFSGLVLILLIFTPLLKITGMEQDFRSIYRSKEYEMERQEMERAAKIYEQAGNLDGLFSDEELAGSLFGNADSESGSSENSVSERSDTAESESGEAGGQIKVEEIKIGE